MTAASESITNYESYVFSIQLTTISNNTAKFKIQPPSNFGVFTHEEQELLLSFIISQFESMPVMTSDEAPEPISSELVGEIVELTLKQSENGFEVSIDGSKSILMSSNSGGLARAIHKDLLLLEAEYLKAVS